MLNPFPELLYLTAFAPFFLRVGFGMVLFFTSFYQLVEKRYDTTTRFVREWPKHGQKFLWAVGIGEVLTGLFLVAGMYVQIVAVIATCASLFATFSHKFHRATNRHVSFYLLTLVISISLLFSGAGMYALDTPL